ncbi:unnamed protein product, partial [Phaeothamnion confervicola]
MIRKGIKTRPRTELDDIHSLLQQSTIQEEGNVLVLPEKRTVPLTLWGGIFPVGVEVSTPVIRRLLTWPLSTTAACHNCAHTFDGVPVP